MEEKTVFLPAINCGHCVSTIKRELTKLGGVQSVEGDAHTQRVVIRWQDPATWPAILAKLTQLGYPAQD